MSGRKAGGDDLTMAGSWRRISYVAVGGLTEVGFGRDARFLLIVSHQGRGVVDCITGARVARNPDDGPAWFNDSAPAARGIGPLQGEWVPVAGLAGGSLAAETADGWRVSADTDGVLVHAPDHRVAKYSFTLRNRRSCGPGGSLRTA